MVAGWSTAEMLVNFSHFGGVVILFEWNLLSKLLTHEGFFIFTLAAKQKQDAGGILMRSSCARAHACDGSSKTSSELAVSAESFSISH